MAEKGSAADTGTFVGNDMQVRVDSIGGIEDCEITFEPGITVLTGPNATNRTSLLGAIAGALGGSRATLKSDADSGFVELTVGGETVRRDYERNGSSVTVRGTALTERSELIDSFACLLETSPARMAVQNGEEFRDVLMGPVDTDEVERQVREVTAEISRLEDRTERIENRKRRLSELEEERATQAEELSEIEDEIASIETDIESFDVDESEALEAESLLDRLEDVRTRRQQTKRSLDRQEEKLERLREERDELQSELAELSVPKDRLSEVEAEISRLKKRKRSYQDDIAALTEVIQFNDDLLTEDGPDIGKTNEDVTASLDPLSESVECWTCGSTVELRRIDERLDGLRDIVEEKRTERDELQRRLSELQSERRELEREVGELSDLERELDEIKRKIDHREEKAENLEETLADIESEIEDIEAEVEETEDLRDSDIADAYQRRSELEYERGQLQQRLDDIDEEIADIEDEAELLPDLERELADKKEERQELRTYIEDLERETVDRFNDHMEEVLDILDYDNITRVWIERTGTDGATGGEADQFEIHVVRETADGAAYEDTVDNLSESERKVIGLVVGLVGYLVHEVYTEVPVVLLDSLEAIDADRISRLLDYFSEFALYLVVALLPEDEQAIAADHERVEASVI